MKVKIEGIFEREIIGLPKAKDYFDKSEDLFYESLNINDIYYYL